MWLIYQVFRGVLVVSGTGEAAQSPFSDVPQDHWAYDAVAQLAADGVIEGYGDTTFQGSKPITRFEMSQMVAKAMAARDAKHVGASDSALIDKLSAEFGDELNHLGVRVSNLERNADKVKFDGFFRMRQEHYGKDSNWKKPPQHKKSYNKAYIAAPIRNVEVGAKYFWGKGVQNDKDMTFVRTEIKYFF